LSVPWPRYPGHGPVEQAVRAIQLGAYDFMLKPPDLSHLGLGPDELIAANPRLVYGRMTGYGQEGPMSRVAGHDINYISIAGVLGAIRRAGERPLAPRPRRGAGRARSRARPAPRCRGRGSAPTATT